WSRIARAKAYQALECLRREFAILELWIRSRGVGIDAGEIAPSEFHALVVHGQVHQDLLRPAGLAGKGDGVFGIVELRGPLQSRYADGVALRESHPFPAPLGVGEPRAAQGEEQVSIVQPPFQFLLEVDAAFDGGIVEKHFVSKLVEAAENLVGKRGAVDAAIADEYFACASVEPRHAQCFVDEAVRPSCAGIMLLESVDLADGLR